MKKIILVVLLAVGIPCVVLAENEYDVINELNEATINVTRKLAECEVADKIFLKKIDIVKAQCKVNIEKSRKDVEYVHGELNAYKRIYASVGHSDPMSKFQVMFSNHFSADVVLPTDVYIQLRKSGELARVKEEVRKAMSKINF